MSPYPEEGSFTTESREVAVSETWDAWANPQSSSNVEVVDGSLQLIEVNPYENSVHRWRMGEGSGSTVADSVGNADGTINGSSWVSGTWIDDNALEGPYVETTTLGSFGSGMANDFAIAVTMQTTANSNAAAIAATNDGDDTIMQLGINIDNVGTDAAPSVMLRDDTGDQSRVYAEETINDGNPHRVVFNKVSNSASDWEIYVDGASPGTQVEREQSFDTPTDFDVPVTLLSRGGDSNFPGIVDNVILFNDTLSSELITADYNNQPWT